MDDAATGGNHPANASVNVQIPLRCRAFGHDQEFRADGRVLAWSCARCGLEGGSKQYASPSEAVGYARTFNRRDTEDLGRRAPLIGLFPLRLWRRLRRS